MAILFVELEKISVTIHVCFAGDSADIQASVLNVLGVDRCTLYPDLAQCCASIECEERPVVVLCCSSLDDVAQVSAFQSSARIAVVGARLGADAVKGAFAIPSVLAVVNGFGGENEFVATRILELFVNGGDSKATALSVLGKDGSLQEYILENSAERGAILNQVEAFIVDNLALERTNASKIYAQRIVSTLDEMMLNAIFGANPELENVDRAQSWPLIGKAQVKVNCAFYENTFVIGVQDNFGSLEKPSIVKHVCDDVSKGITQRRSGGLGTRLAYEGSTSMLYQVSPQNYTSAFLVVRAVASQKQFKSNPKSIGFFSRAS
jgi:hypothetical protein